MSESSELEVFLILKGKKCYGTIENWYISHDEFDIMNNQYTALFGEFSYIHPRWGEKLIIRQGVKFLKIHYVEKIVEFYSSFYKLGVPKVIEND